RPTGHGRSGSGGGTRVAKARSGSASGSSGSCSTTAGGASDFGVSTTGSAGGAAGVVLRLAPVRRRRRLLVRAMPLMINGPLGPCSRIPHHLVRRPHAASDAWEKLPVGLRPPPPTHVL